MKERPILFNDEMIRAILECRKTQTRRIVKHKPDLDCPYHENGVAASNPFGHVGDRLWVPEYYRYVDWTEDVEPIVRYKVDGSKKLRRPSEDWIERVCYIWESLSSHENYSIDGFASDRMWRPASRMPRWASRILLEITSVRIERIQDISRADAKAEGFLPSANGLEQYAGKSYGNAQIAFAACWRSIYGDDSWESNPRVWVIEFKIIKG